jgi:hypothetical protein
MADAVFTVILKTGSVMISEADASAVSNAVKHGAQAVTVRPRTTCCACAPAITLKIQDVVTLIRHHKTDEIVTPHSDATVVDLGAVQRLRAV